MSLEGVELPKFNDAQMRVLRGSKVLTDDNRALTNS